MKIQNKVILIFSIFLLVLSGCSSEEQKQAKYNDCTAACAGVVDGTSDEALVALEICRQDCEDKFLG